MKKFVSLLALAALLLSSFVAPLSLKNPFWVSGTPM